MNLDFTALSDDQLVELIRAALQDAVRRGAAVEAAVRAAGLDEAEKAKVAKAAAEREAARIRAEEAARVAAEAAAKVRRETEKKAKDAEIAAVEKLWEKKKAAAAGVREFLGYQCDFRLEVWSRGADKRVYVAKVNAKFGDNVIDYFHTGNTKNKPRSLKIHESWLESHSERNGITPDQSRERLLTFLGDLCAKWNAVRIDVDEDMAPTPPEVWADYYAMVWDAPNGSKRYAGDKKCYEKDHRWVSEIDVAEVWLSTEDAIKAKAEFACHDVADEKIELVSVRRRTF